MAARRLFGGSGTVVGRLRRGGTSRPARRADRAATTTLTLPLYPSIVPVEGGACRGRAPGKALEEQATKNGSYDIYLVRPGRAQRCVTPRNASRGRRRRRQHRLGNIPQQVAVALDVGPEAGILPFLFIKPHAQSIALVDQHLLLPSQRIVLLLEVLEFLPLPFPTNPRVLPIPFSADVPPSGISTGARVLHGSWWGRSARRLRERFSRGG